MSFLQTVGAAVKSAAKTVSDSTKAAYASATSVPTEITCSNEECGRQVLVPKASFDWRCAGCQTANAHEDEKCKQCSAAPPKGLKYWCKCSACGTVSEVPSTKAKQSLANAGRSAKTMLATTAAATKAQYKHLTGHAAEFNCTTCDARLKNPNPPPLSPEELKEQAGTAPDGQAAAPAGQMALIEKVECPICHSVTDVPGSVLAGSMASAGAKAKKGGAKAVAFVKREKNSPCPVCEHPVVVPPEHLPAASAASSAAAPSAPSADGAGAPAAAAAAAAAAAPAAAATEVSVQLTCPNCTTAFPAKVTV